MGAVAIPDSSNITSAIASITNNCTKGWLDFFIASDPGGIQTHESTHPDGWLNTD